MLITCEGTKQEVTTEEELAEFAAKLRAHLHEPAILTAAHVDQPAYFQVGIGARLSVIEYSESHEGPYWISRSDRVLLTPGEEIGFTFAGQWSEFPPDAHVPPSLADEALRAFFRSGGEKPPFVTWQQV